MNKYLFDILLNQQVNGVGINFCGDSYYYRGATANETINFRNNIHNEINNQGFTNEIQRQILKWGGIHGFRQYEYVNSAIQLLQTKNTIETRTANAISSYSKLFAFYSPTNYFILDARVAYVINKIIISNRINSIAPLKFNIIRSRNKNLSANYKVLMNNWNGSTISVENFYSAYCLLIKEIHKYFIDQNPKVFTNRGFINSDPEIIEMLLFFLADYL